MASNTTICANTLSSNSMDAGTLNHKLNVISVSGGNKVLSMADSGSVVIPSGGARTITLPAVASANGFNMILFSGSAHSHILKTASNSDTSLEGSIMHNANAGTPTRQEVTGRKQITLTNNPLVGDVIRVHCDGTNYFINGDVNNAVVLA